MLGWSGWRCLEIEKFSWVIHQLLFLQINGMSLDVEESEVCIVVIG